MQRASNEEPHLASVGAGMKVDLVQAVHCLTVLSQPVAIPTETVWGLAAPIHDEACIRKIFFLKGRPLANPLIIHIDELEAVQGYARELPPGFEELSGTFWPGPLTLVIPVLEATVLPIVRAGLPTAAFRMPDHADARKLIHEVGPLVAPSANRSGTPSALTPQHIEQDFGAWLPILQTRRACRHGIESTILVWKNSSWYLGRYGAIDTKKIAKVLGYSPMPSFHTDGAPVCPGQLHRHYAPKAQLALMDQPWGKNHVSRYDGVLGFSDRDYPDATAVVHLGTSRNSRSVYKTLYSSLRQLDQLGLRRVFVDLYGIELTSEWLPLIDRLHKASAGQAG